MKRLGRRLAGRHVHARAQALSDDLLADEEWLFQEIDRLYSLQAEVAIRMYDRSLRGMKSVDRLKNDRQLRMNLVALQKGVGGDVRGLVGALAGTARRKSLESIEEELAVVAKTQGEKFVGLESEAVLRTSKAASLIVSTLMTKFGGDQWYAQAKFDTEMTRLILQATDPDSLLVELFSPGTPKGAWWGPAGSAKIGARWVSVTCTNQVREVAMKAFNEAHRRRRNS